MILLLCTFPPTKICKSQTCNLQVCGPEGSQCIVPYPSPTDSGLIQVSALMCCLFWWPSCIVDCGLHALVAIQMTLEQAMLMFLLCVAHSACY